MHEVGKTGFGETADLYERARPPRGSSHRTGGLIRTAEVVRMRRADCRTETVGFSARQESEGARGQVLGWPKGRTT
jgi:hypothetical protein